MKFIKKINMSRNKNKSAANGENAEMEAPDNGGGIENSDNNAEVTTSETENLTEEANADGQESQPSGDANEQLMAQVKDWQEKYIRLSADFDNFRKRTMREKMDLIKTASEEVIVSILPVIDDFERAKKAMENVTEVGPVKEGIELIYNKFKDILSQKGIKPIDAQNQEFNTDLHEAITNIPAPDESLKGKVVDVIQQGYMLQDKVVRYAKVVVGE
jgi:molecular chaperone GrpE